MHGIGLSLSMEIALSLLLVATLVYCALLERKLTALRKSQDKLKDFIGELNAAITTAGSSMRMLKSTAAGAAETLDERVAAAVAECGVCGLVGQAMREQRSWLLALGGVRALGAYGFVAALQATASISLATEVNGRSVTVTGSTDLPEGAIVDVLLVQQDAYDRSVAQGGGATVDSPWVRYVPVPVHDGRFAASFDVSPWPSGRAYAMADFWMDPNQPAAAVDRFGLDGSGLRGPDVVATSDRGPELQVTSHFALR